VEGGVVDGKVAVRFHPVSLEATEEDLRDALPGLALEDVVITNKGFATATVDIGDTWAHLVGKEITVKGVKATIFQAKHSTTSNRPSAAAMHPLTSNRGSRGGGKMSPSPTTSTARTSGAAEPISEGGHLALPVSMPSDPQSICTERVSETTTSDTGGYATLEGMMDYVPELQVGERVHVREHGPGIIIAIKQGRKTTVLEGGVRKKAKGVGKARYIVKYDDDSSEAAVRQDQLITRKRGMSQPALVMMNVPFEAQNRAASTPSAIFNLVSTMLGGGILSLPFAIYASGMFLGGLALILSAIANAFTVDLLVVLSQSTGCQNYEAIGRKAFGRSAQIITMLLISLLTWLALIAYAVLIGDLLGINKSNLCY